MYWGFDVKNIDKSVRAQDDFYQYANGGWLRKTKIPPEESRWGSFIVLRYNTEHQLKKIVTTTKHPLVRGVYRSATDMQTRNKLDAGPMAPLRLLVRDIKNKEDLLRVIARLHVLGVSAGWGAMVDQDSKDSTKYILHLWQGGLGMPERDYYLLDKPEQKRVRSAYIVHIKKLSALAGATAKESQKISRVVLEIETALAHASMKKENARDSEKVYHKFTIVQLQKLSPNVDWADYFARTHAPNIKTLIVGQPEFFKAVSAMLETVPLEEWKTYLEWHVVSSCAGLLSERFVREQFAYVKILTGQKKMRALWRRALGATGVVGDALGEGYVKRYFPAASKHTMDALVGDLFDVYESRIKKLDWMSAATKRKAVVKLRAMKRKIGYPSKWEHYKGLSIEADDYFGNMLRAAQWHHRKQMRKLRKPIDRAEWFMYPHTVNAYHHSNLNEIVFPAAILQWPFFDPRADMAVNYAGIGSVIGHEITHGFDDQGSKFDAKGNMKSWWTTADRKRFMQKSKRFVSQANEVEVEPGVHINGQLTLGENMADMGGLVIAYEAYQRYLKKTGRLPADKAGNMVAGLSPEERFFLGYAQMEREQSRPEVKKLAALTDPHAQAQWRINGPLSNFEPFYQTFNIKKGDRLYRSPSSRAQVW